MNISKLTVGKLLAVALGLWLAFTSFGEILNYGRLTIALLIFWVCAIWLKQMLEQDGRLGNGWLLWGANALIAIIPGSILLWYGLFSPVRPSLTNSGVDVCAFETGWCVSGSRAFVFLGGLALLAGLAWSAFMFRIERRVVQRK